MLLSNIPAFLTKVWNHTGVNRRTIPVASSPTPGQASYTDGFPPITFLAPGAGGINVSGQDFQGIIYDITRREQWMQAGCGYPYSATFSAAIGGYPKGATIPKAGGTGWWKSTVDGNTSNPDTGGAGWDSIVDDTTMKNGYASSLNEDGYIKMPAWLGGWIVQWATITQAVTADVPAAYTWTFPIPFPSACIFVMAGAGNQITSSWTAEAYTATTMSGYCQHSITMSIIGRVFAIGK
jgi:hypothetical protein